MADDGVVTLDQAQAYKLHVQSAVKANKEPLRLAKFLNKKSGPETDIRRVVWEDYWNHMKESASKKQEGKMIHEFIRDKYADTDQPLLYRRDDSTAKACLSDLLGNGGVALSFSGANKKLDTALRDRMTVADEAVRAMNEVFLNEAKGDPKVMQTVPYVPFGVAGMTTTPETQDATRSALIKLFDVLNTKLTPKMLQDALDARWSVKKGWFGKSNTYVPLAFDPRLLPKECASSQMTSMYKLWRKVAYGTDRMRITDKAEIKKNILNLSDKEKVDLEHYLHWMKRSIRHEISDGKLQVKKQELLSDKEIIRQLKPAVESEQPVPVSVSEEGEAEEFLDEDTEAVISMVRGSIQKGLRDAKAKTHDVPHILPKNAVPHEYPSASNPEHVFHVHALIGALGNSPAVLTSRELALYESTKDKPLPIDFNDTDVVLAAASKAAFKRFSLAPEDELDIDELSTHANAIAKMANTPEKKLALIHDARAAHVNIPHGKPILDFSGPVWSVQHAREGTNDGWSSMMPEKLGRVAKGLRFMLDSRDKMPQSESVHGMLSRVFNTSDYQQHLEALVNQCAWEITHNKHFKMTPFELSSLTVGLGVKDPLSKPVQPETLKEMPDTAVKTITPEQLMAEADDVPIIGSDVPVVGESGKDEGEDTEGEDHGPDETSSDEEEEEEANEPMGEDTFFDVHLGMSEKPYQATAAGHTEATPPRTEETRAQTTVTLANTISSRKFVPLSQVAKNAQANRTPARVDSRLVVDAREYTGCVVLLPKTFSGAGKTWNKADHYMRVTKATLDRYKQSGIITTETKNQHMLKSLVSETELGAFHTKLLAMKPDSSALIIPINDALSEVSLTH